VYYIGTSVLLIFFYYSTLLYTVVLCNNNNDQLSRDGNLFTLKERDTLNKDFFLLGLILYNN